MNEQITMVLVNGKKLFIKHKHEIKHTTNK